MDVIQFWGGTGRYTWTSGLVISSMKIRQAIFAFILAAPLFWACAGHSQDSKSAQEPHSTTSEQSQMSDSIDLELKFKPEFRGMIGYGSIFRCEVTGVATGEFPDEEFFMTVMYNDSTVQDQLNAGANGKELTATFVLHQKEVTQNRLPITGFVDKSKTAWKLVEIGSGK